MKIGTGINPQEPFALYTLSMAKADSDRALQPHRDHRKRVEQWREFGYTLTTALLALTLPTLAAIYA